MEILEYYVMVNEGGHTMWLADDEKTWTRDLHSAACFTGSKLAHEIGVRQRGDTTRFYVMACLGMQDDDEEATEAAIANGEADFVDGKRR